MKSWSTILGWLLSPVAVLLIVITLLIWHPLIAGSRRINITLHQWIIEVGNLLLIFHLRFVGGIVRTEWSPQVPAQGPLVIVSNHQSFFDIPIFIWVFRRYHPRFVAKLSLGRGFPSVSYVLRTGGSALVDRGNPRQAVPAIQALGRFALRQRYAACIFPEGTRARDGVLKDFKAAGFRALLEAMPEAPVVPVAISEAWQLMRYGLKPIPFGVQVRVSVLPPLSRTELSDDMIISRSEEIIRNELARLSPNVAQEWTGEE
ncbi:MAG: 1-acyl-sn-glycerol-3-phosphate acyltransferase [Proteobacteria bacterium]|nr:1-acyl-sn-glycerol-3-phosphate acyltransferase [Pseudomonadota bacterium]